MAHEINNDADDRFINSVIKESFGVPYAGMSSDRKQLLMLAIIAKRLEAQEITVEPIVPTFSAEVSLNLERMQDDANRYRWMRDHWFQVEAPPNNPEVMITFHRDKSGGDGSKDTFDNLLDRLIKGE